MSQIILSVQAADMNGNIKGSLVTDIPELSSFNTQLGDLSGPEAGRVQSMDMWKDRRGFYNTLTCSWKNVSPAVASKVVQSFNSEYMWVSYYNVQTGDYSRKLFYRTDVTADLYSLNTPSGTIWGDVNFQLIQSKVDKV